jgi:hypothetical protein
MPTFPCPHCSVKLQVPESQIAHKVRCPRCKNISVAPAPADFSLVPAAADSPAPGPSAGARASGPTPDDAESVLIACPRCEAWNEVPAQRLGQDVTCAECLQVVPTPMPSESSSRPAAAPAAAPAPAALPATADGRGVMAPPGKPDRKAASPGEAVQPAPSPSPDAPSPDLAVPRGKRKSGKRKKKKRKGWFPRLPAIAVEGGMFKPVLIGAAGILVVAGLIFALRTMFEKGGAPNSIPSGFWQTYEVKDRFTALLPIPFRTTQPDLAVLGGDVVIKARASWPEDNISSANAIYTQWYSAGYSPKALPAAHRGVSEKDLLNRICNDVLANGKSAGDEEIKRRPISLGSFPGMELTVSVRHGKNITRVYLAHHRIYLVAAGGRGIEPNQPNVKRLFESLQILDTGKDSAPPRGK